MYASVMIRLYLKAGFCFHCGSNATMQESILTFLGKGSAHCMGNLTCLGFPDRLFLVVISWLLKEKLCCVYIQTLLYYIYSKLEMDSKIIYLFVAVSFDPANSFCQKTSEEGNQSFLFIVTRFVLHYLHITSRKH